MEDQKQEVMDTLTVITAKYKEFNESIEKLYFMKEKAVGYKESENDWQSSYMESNKKKLALDGTPFSKRTEEKYSRAEDIKL